MCELHLESMQANNNIHNYLPSKFMLNRFADCQYQMN